MRQIHRAARQIRSRFARKSEPASDSRSQNTPGADERARHYGKHNITGIMLRTLAWESGRDLPSLQDLHYR